VRNIGSVALLYTRHPAEGGEKVRITALDPQTGREIAVSRPRYFYSRVDTCPENPDTVCTQVWCPPDNRSMSYRFGEDGSG